MSRPLPLLALLGSLLACTAPSGGLPQFHGTYTLQGTVMDAVTGARLGGSDLELYLVQGAEVRRPTALHADASDPLVGEYAFADIPLGAARGNITYKLVVLKPGYQRFESDLAVAIATDAGVLDTVYNRLGNVYLYPLGASAGEVTFTVTYLGLPVPGATVQLLPWTTYNFTLLATSDRLPATTGLLANLSATSDAAGRVTFQGSELALGAVYIVEVLPVLFTTGAGTHIPLGFQAVRAIAPGMTDVTAQLKLSDLLQQGTPPLYVTFASSEVVGHLEPTGALSVTLSTPVTLVNPDGFGAAGVNLGVGFGTPPVTAGVSADGLTVTLTPNLAGPIPGGAQGVSVTFSDGTALVAPRDFPAATRRLFGLTFADGVALDPTVILRP